MKFKIAVSLVLTAFFVYCGSLVLETGLFEDSSEGLVPLASVSGLKAMAAVNDNTAGQETQYDMTSLMAVPGKSEIVTLGSRDRQSEFFYELNLDTKGASIRNAYLNRYDNLNPDDPQEYLMLLNPVEKETGNEVLSYANDSFVLIDQKLKLRLNNLNWKFLEKTVDANGAETARFSTIILDAQGRDIIELEKVYEITPGIHHLLCRINVKNISAVDIQSRFDMQGPVGLPREGVRTDLRKIISAYSMPNQNIETVKLTALDVRKGTVDWLRGKNSPLEFEEKMNILHESPAANFLWVASVDKYFAAITRPLPDNNSTEWVYVDIAEFYEPGLRSYPDKKQDDLAAAGFKFHVRDFELNAGQTKSFDFQIYLGAKDKELFETNDLYASLGFINTIDFQSCCTFGWVTSMAFMVLGIMKWMYMFIPNYGLVIIILVLVVRLILHPITKKSQISMMSMQKLGPKSEEIKKKYENNKAEMNKQMMLLYREHGASPVLGCLPMLLQMPIWIALYSAIYASVELRGAAFLPFWITDLSSPDALFRFPEFTIPLLNVELNSFNLLPILLGVSFYLQQKLMPHTSGKVDPKMAQQQKMMQWMMPIMMLVFLYKAPSGLNLYIMASTFGGVIEQTVIRKHIRERKELEEQGKVPVTKKTGGKKKKKKPKPFFKNQM